MSDEWTQDEEARRLLKRFDDLKAATGMKKAEFARVYKVPGGASMISQHIHGRRPINLDAALAYSTGFNVSIGEISPRVANEVARGTLGLGAGSAGKVEEPGVSYMARTRQERWPFSRVDFDKLVSLQGVDARNLENALLAAAGDLDLDIRVARSGKIRRA